MEGSTRVPGFAEVPAVCGAAKAEASGCVVAAVPAAGTAGAAGAGGAGAVGKLTPC